MIPGVACLVGIAPTMAPWVGFGHSLKVCCGLFLSKGAALPRSDEEWEDWWQAAPDLSGPLEDEHMFYHVLLMF